MRRPPIPTRGWRSKPPGQPAKLAYHGRVCMENRHGLVVQTALTPADSYAEVDAALRMAERLPPGRLTIGGDRWSDQRRCVTELRQMGITPHVAQWPTTVTSTQRD